MIDTPPNRRRALPLLLLLLCALLPACQQRDYLIKSEAYRDPSRFEKDIERFEAADAQQMPPKDAVLAVGSSSIRKWHGQIAEDLAPLTVIPRGFGGSNTNDLLHYADRIVLKYHPRAVMIYEGDNDIAQGVSPQHIEQTYKKLLDKIERALPGCRVYVLAVKPSPLRWAMWPKMADLNKRLAALAKSRRHVTYIDTAAPALGEDGKPDPALFVNDGLHLNREGYLRWRDTVRPVLVEAEKRYEQ